jgi:S-(hydroxymethyl)glutathione dehydrogenase/alcohol dehydrogenase
VRAAILYEAGKPLVVEEGVDLPELRPGHVLVDVALSGVCHSQLHEVRGERGHDPWVPHLLGHEAVGTVRDVGSRVTKVSPGNRVILTWIRSEGLEEPGALYRKGDVTINSGGVTTFSESTVVSENRVVPLPGGLPDEVAPLFGCALMTGVGSVLNIAQPTADDAVAVWGAGGIGLPAIMAAATRGCRMIAAIDVVPEKLELARALGATHTLLVEDLDRTVTELNDLTDGGVDYAFEASSRGAVIERAFLSVRPGGGTCIVMSHPAENDSPRIPPLELHRGRRLRGSWGGESKPDRDIPRFAALYREGKLPVERLLSHRYPLEDVNQALDDLESGRVARALLDIRVDRAA